ncbi:hypothetical protein J2847_003291 [Azospirillum agricola]|uniref:hypothetical protein n=1 Tax=Azospirillum agricola TaxID=1720247 RepID=UPI001AE7ECCB|nr:hypothetical protein [Azospirillum agricola]MBP2229988.1 hypothetical protein [Azospirillum agricola]
MSSDRLMKLGAWERPAEMPDSLAAEVAGWPVIVRGPGGGGFYSQPGQPWLAPEEGCLRAADRWNLEAAPGDGEGGGLRFATDRPLPARAGWALARREGGVWVLLSADAVEPREVREHHKERAERLVASRRWTRSDLEVIQALLGTDATPRAALLAADPAGRERSLRSLLALRLALEVPAGEAANPELPDAVRSLLRGGAEAVVWLDEDGRAVASDVLAWHARRHARVEARNDRRAEERGRGDDLKQSIATAVRNVFPAMPAEVAASAAARLAPSVAKLGRRPGTQNIVDAVVEIRLERWRQAIASEPEVEERLLAMQARGANGRVRKRFRDQRAAERVEQEIRDWRGDLEPVSSHRLG